MLVSLLFDNKLIDSFSKRCELSNHCPQYCKCYVDLCHPFDPNSNMLD